MVERPNTEEKAIAELVIADSVNNFKQRDPSFDDESFLRGVLSDEQKLINVANRIPAFYLGDPISAEKLLINITKIFIQWKEF